MTTIDVCELAAVYGGLGKATAPVATAEAKTEEFPTRKATYGDACLRGGVGGAITGATAGAGMLPFAMLSGPLTPATAGAFLGIGGGTGAVLGCAEGMWDLYKARRPLEP
jgi:hypothetical protein